VDPAVRERWSEPQADRRCRAGGKPRVCPRRMWSGQILLQPVVPPRAGEHLETKAQASLSQLHGRRGYRPPLTVLPPSTIMVSPVT
jgi:hypothetical protein